MAASTFTRHAFSRWPVYNLDVLPVASGGLDLGRHNDEDLTITALQTYASANLSPTQEDLDAMQRMGNDGLRKSTGICMSSAFSRAAAIGLGTAAVGRSWSGFPSEIGTSLTCNPTLCPACSAVRATYGISGEPLITFSRDTGAGTLIGFPKVPDLWLDWNIALANGIPSKIVCGAMYSQGIYMDVLPGPNYSLPANLRLCITINLFKTPYEANGEILYRRARYLFKPTHLWVYDIVPDANSQFTVGPATDREFQGFLGRRKRQGYRGAIIEHLHD